MVLYQEGHNKYNDNTQHVHVVFGYCKAWREYIIIRSPVKYWIITEYARVPLTSRFLMSENKS